MSDNLVTMNVSQDIIKPIVETKIKEAISAALGGPDSIVKYVVEQVLNSRVNEEGNVSRYDSENKYTWIDAIVTSQIKDVVSAVAKEQIKNQTGKIKKEIENYLKSKQGSSEIASLMCASMADSIGASYFSKVKLEFVKRDND